MFPTMDNMQEKLISRYFQKVDNVVWDLMTGKIGIETKDGIATIEGEGETARPVYNIFDQMSVPIPAFAQSTPKDGIKLGDIIIRSSGAGWVTEIKDGSLTLLKPDGSSGRWTPPKYSTAGLMDLDGAMVVRSLFSMVGNNGVKSMQDNLLPLMMLSGGTGKGNRMMDKMLPIMLMQQMGGASVMTTPTETPKAVYKKDDDGNLELDENGDPIVLEIPAPVQPVTNNNMFGGNMMQTMMLMSMMGDSNGGKNFFDRGE
jgi:hypothetical protein